MLVIILHSVLHLYYFLFAYHFTAIPDAINKKNINVNYCLTKTPVNNQNMLSYSLKHVFQNLFPSIKCNCTTTKETENVIMAFNLLPVQFKSLLPGQEGCVFFSGHLNLPVQPVRLSTFRQAGEI
jgi:hypothetical protein